MNKAFSFREKNRDCKREKMRKRKSEKDSQPCQKASFGDCQRNSKDRFSFHSQHQHGDA